MSQTSNKLPLKGFVKDTYTVHNKTIPILSYFLLNCKLFTHFSYLYSIPFKIKEESIIIAKNIKTMNKQTKQSTNRGLEALLKLVLGEITIEQAEQIINTMNDQEPNHRGDLSL